MRSQLVGTRSLHAREPAGRRGWGKGSLQPQLHNAKPDPEYIRGRAFAKIAPLPKSHVLGIVAARDGSRGGAPVLAPAPAQDEQEMAIREGGAKACREFRTSRRALNVLSVRAGLPEQQVFAPRSPGRRIVAAPANAKDPASERFPKSGLPSLLLMGSPNAKAALAGAGYPPRIAYLTQCPCAPPGLRSER